MHRFISTSERGRAFKRLRSNKHDQSHTWFLERPFSHLPVSVYYLSGNQQSMWVQQMIVLHFFVIKFQVLDWVISHFDPVGSYEYPVIWSTWKVLFALYTAKGHPGKCRMGIECTYEPLFLPIGSSNSIPTHIPLLNFVGPTNRTTPRFLSPGSVDSTSQRASVTMSEGISESTTVSSDFGAANRPIWCRCLYARTVSEKVAQIDLICCHYWKDKFSHPVA